jgi:hypothetical protein
MDGWMDIYVYVYICMYALMFDCMFECMFECMMAFKCVSVCVCMYVCIYIRICVHVCTYVYAYIFVCMAVCVYVYTGTTHACTLLGDILSTDSWVHSALHVYASRRSFAGVLSVLMQIHSLAGTNDNYAITRIRMYIHAPLLILPWVNITSLPSTGSIIKYSYYC